MLCVGAGVTVISLILISILAYLWQAGTQADWLVMVADTRRTSSVILHYFVNLYNTNRGLMAVWIAALTLACGGIVGLLMDVLTPNARQNSDPRNSRGS